MLKEAMIKQLNAQINLELFSANLYLQMSAWCEQNALEGAAAFFRVHSDEEMSHMHRLFHYMNERSALPLIGAVAAPSHQFDSLLDVFQQSYQHEQQVTEKINHLAQFAMTSQDYATFHFLQWYITEQIEEERLFKGILDKLNLVGSRGEPLFFIDKELAKLAKKSS